MKETKVAVIGVGNMGRHHVRVYSELTNVKLVAISDVNKNVGEIIAKKYGCKFYCNYKEMLEKEEIDGVSIATPTSLHKDVALDVINANKHVLIEKPLADTVENAKKIIKAAKEKDVKLMVGHIERFNPAVRKLKEIINERKLGDIKTIIIRRVGLFPPRIKDTNVIIDLAIHDIDICNYLLGKEPAVLYATAGKALTNRQEDYADIFLRYGTINVFIQVNWITPVKIRNLSITGTKGYAELNYITQDLKIYESIFEKSRDETFEEVVKFGQPKEIHISVNKKEPLKEELKSFISYINGGVCEASGEEALKALEVATKIINFYRKQKLFFKK
ncbi:MAG: Gfo/Idh/MocA family oxidoreductase [Candidatus Aenigmatarchaeota archaeon]